MATLEVHAVGPLAMLEDKGRPGLAAIGVPPSGAVDRVSLAQGNRLLGNPDKAAGIEVLLGGLAVSVDETIVFVVTGAPCPLSIDGRPVGFGAALPLRPGQVLRLGVPVAALRSYLVVRGGLLASSDTRHFGSSSSDPTSGLGPAPLAAGDRIEVGAVVAGNPRYDLEVPPVGSSGGELDLHATLGPRDDWLTPESVEVLGAAAWEVTAEGDRVGVRLAGPALSSGGPEQLPSEGIVRGAVQVPPSGQPVVFLADHPTTGGYPVVAVMDDADTDRLAQLRPGERLRLHLRRARWLEHDRTRASAGMP
ncbi:biotin-dependent carboxyltransferase family protein [Leekyejoonella antrihumi]|uniref:Biotin-dependent carboxyltransferase family protein n=1 Tax=Leekyejoonella antrihumi TaxID=1660198 RepID=A0A563E4E5_9MICO|nr:biotin-dependent carboxyltransferase family protein [Leekyejoonella antrihumi]TWP37397.1 biotin-dependent carboxyltransferase family protein [Leekyejoonella antrihumi]